MTLDEFLSRTEMTEQAFAVAVGRDRTSINRLRRGETKPDWKTAEAIAKFTGGKVTPNDFLPQNIDDESSKISGDQGAAA